MLGRARTVVAICCLAALCAARVFAASDVVPDDAFSWRQCAGQNLKVMLSQHFYSDGIKRHFQQFEKLTGIRIAYVVYPEDVYFPRLNAAFDSPPHSPDVFMTGVYQIWKYAPEGRMMPLDHYLNSRIKTRAIYNIDDFYPSILGAFRWNRKFGHMLGRGELWAIPIGFEANAITYNREVLSRFRLTPPKSMEELVEMSAQLRRFEGENTYGVAVRGAGEWNSLHSGYVTALANYGGQDMAIENGKLVSKVNSPANVALTELWVKMLRNGSAPDWEYMNWYRCLEDVGSRKAAMMFDADILGYSANVAGSTPQAGRLAMSLPPHPAGAESVKSNLWSWALAINAKTRVPDAAWIFLQYFTSREFQKYSVTEWKSLNPPRRSVFEDPDFQLRMREMDGYAETLSTIVDNTQIYFTPNPHFFDIAERWAAVIRDIANGMYGSTQEGLAALKVWMDNKLSDVEVEENSIGFIYG